MLLKYFVVRGCVHKAPKVLIIIWKAPCVGFMKCNVDGATYGSSGLATCNGIFRGSPGDYLGAFSFVNKKIGAFSSFIGVLALTLKPNC